MQLTYQFEFFERKVAETKNPKNDSPRRVRRQRKKVGKVADSIDIQDYKKITHFFEKENGKKVDKETPRKAKRKMDISEEEEKEMPETPKRKNRRGH